MPTISFATLYVFFFVSHARRRIEHIHVTEHPTAEWVWRQLIEATPWGRRPRFLVRDRDRAYGGDFIAR
ncbi:MAG TPA: integrase, partial [Dehalococcoidia bacterium]